MRYCLGRIEGTEFWPPYSADGDISDGEEPWEPPTAQMTHSMAHRLLEVTPQDIGMANSILSHSDGDVVMPMDTRDDTSCNPQFSGLFSPSLIKEKQLYHLCMIMSRTCAPRTIVPCRGRS